MTCENVDSHGSSSYSLAAMLLKEKDTHRKKKDVNMMANALLPSFVGGCETIAESATTEKTSTQATGAEDLSDIDAASSTSTSTGAEGIMASCNTQSTIEIAEEESERVQGGVNNYNRKSQTHKRHLKKPNQRKRGRKSKLRSDDPYGDAERERQQGLLVSTRTPYNSAKSVSKQTDTGTTRIDEKASTRAHAPHTQSYAKELANANAKKEFRREVFNT